MNNSSDSRRARITLADTETFAGISGDHNPIHLDATEARRLLFGTRTVHGVHIVLSALEATAQDIGFSRATSLKATFEHPVAVDEPCWLSWSANGDRMTATVETERGVVARLTVRFTNEVVAPWEGTRVVPREACATPSIESLQHARGDLELTLPDEWKRLFPRLAERFSHVQVATLLGITRLVGMRVPGRDSILSGISLDFDGNETDARSIEYQTARLDTRFRLLEISINAPGTRGRITTFIRPSPVRQPSMSSLGDTIRAGEFAGQRALVVGGSRGLGELLAKMLAVGGADVTITYATGRDDAERVVREAAEAGYVVTSGRYDVLADSPPTSVSWPPTHLYYMATPRIPVTSRGFDASTFALLNRFYVDGVRKTAEWLASVSPAACYWFPSTVFLNDDAGGRFEEYVAAKAAGETLCRQLSISLAPLRIEIDRLPRLPTDQTQSLTVEPLGDAVAVLETVLRRLQTPNSAASSR